MSVGLMALFDDVATLAKAAAASIDDVAGQAAKAGSKAAGVVIDDTAVTPRYLTGFSAARELPIIWRIALGSLRNKLLILLPAALAFSLLLPQAITPLLMLGGAYLCYEGAEKVYEALFPHAAHDHEAKLEPVAIDAASFEEEKIASAIKTDFILSAEIMAITLAALPGGSFANQAAVLAVVGIGITLGVYGAVALIVKADDAGLALARLSPESSLAAPLRLVGRGLVRGMPWLLGGLSTLGTAAMIWVGGGIVLHGLESFGLGGPAHALHDAGAWAGAAVARAVPVGGAFVAWLVEAAGAGVVGFGIGLLAIPLTSRVLSPLWRGIKSWIRRMRPRGRDG
jgi:predicted DNA repair protein MutK